MTPTQPSPHLRGAGSPPSDSSAAVDRNASQVVTLLAIDLAESSTVLASLGEDRLEGSRAAYLTLLRNGIAAHRGREILRDGDRMLIAFDTPSEAVGCAVTVLRASERQSRRWSNRLDVRIGIHVGEAVEAAAVSDRGDYVARPAIQARRLCDAALGGQILVSDLVSALSRSDASYTFERAGLVELEGFADPVPTYEIIHERLASERPPLPPELAARPVGRCSFVGRAAERERLREVWSAAASGERRMAFLMGEPGIGKSRFAAEFAAEVHAGGGVVLSGRSFEESIVPYQPFVESLRQYVADCEPIDLEAQLGGDPSPIAWLVPEITSRLPALPAGRHGELEGERYRLFEAVAMFLATISVGAPVLLVLDDLQWADQATLLLLKHIALDPRPASMLILGMYRDGEVTAAHPLTQLQADVERDFSIDRVMLAGLEDADVAHMLTEMIGWSPPATVAQDLRSDTEGNPFFLQEVINQLAETGIAADRERMAQGHLVAGQLGVPNRIRDFVARRMQRLSAEVLEVLGVAAIVGTEFGLDILTAVLATDTDRLVGQLDEAVETRLIVEVPGRTGTYAFAHALFQQALYEWHSGNRRASLHARVAEAIEALRPNDPSALSELARHYALTAGRYAEKVVHYGSAAGDRALAGLAYEDAIEEYTRALDALPLAASADELAKADLLVRLGEAQTRTGDAPFKDSFLSAAEHCVGEGFAPVLARAALGYGGTGTFGGVMDSILQVDDVLVGLLERALAACPNGDDPIRVRLLGRLATALYWSDDKERCLTLSREALQSARRIGDPVEIAYALHSRHTALWGPDHISEARAVAEEMLAIGGSLGDREIQHLAAAWLVSDTLQTDPIETADEYLATCARLAGELHQPYLLGHAESIQAMRAGLEGRFDDMVRLSLGTFRYGQGAYATNAQQAHLVQMTMLQLELGCTTDELIAGLASAAAPFPISLFGAALALAYATAERRDEAATELARFAAHGFASIPRDSMWVATLGMLAQVVVAIDAIQHARPLYDLLAPYADLNCTIAGGFMHFGPVSRFLGMLATILGEPDLALRHFEGALERSSDLGSPPNEARVKGEMARALLARGAAGDASRALSLLEEAKQAADELGMVKLARDAADLLSMASKGAGRSGSV